MNEPPADFRRPRAIIAGFTLIEILVVIAIVALLAAILFPVFAQARAKSRQTACLSNLKQIGVAIELYRQDYDSRFPMAVDDTRNGKHGVTIWQSDQPEVRTLLSQASTLPHALAAYARDNAIWHCPDDTGGLAAFYDCADAEDTYPAQITSSFFDVFGSSYRYRTEAGFVTGAFEDAPATSLGDVSISPTEVIIAGDGRDWHFASHPNAVQSFFTDTPASNYDGFQNTLFADGHAKALTREQFSTLWLGSLGVE